MQCHIVSHGGGSRLAPLPVYDPYSPYKFFAGHMERKKAIYKRFIEEKKKIYGGRKRVSADLTGHVYAGSTRKYEVN